jgi:hypothetical protein
MAWTGARSEPRGSSTRARRQSLSRARKRASDPLPRALPRFRLHHGQAVWVLTQLGFRGDASANTFKEYVKSLRKLGTPFARGEVGPHRRSLANYSFYHLMELGLILSLRVYRVVPDSLVIEIVAHRTALYRCYRRAYAARCTGKGSPIRIRAHGQKPICIRGVFLDLQAVFAGGVLSRFGPPRLLSPFEALETFAEHHADAPSLLPFGLSALAERLVAAAIKAPIIKSGPINRSRYITGR